MSNSSNPYATKAMLVSVAFSKWDARRYDKEVSEEVATNHQTSAKAGRYNKRLFLDTPQSLQAVQSAMSAAQDTYYTETLPWSDDGCRLLPATNYLIFCDKMRAHQATIEAAVRVFVAEYPQLINAAKQQLNGLFKAEDYPPVSKIAEKFSMFSKFYPVPTGQDFRVELAKDHLAALQRAVDSDTQRAIDDAVIEAYGLLFDQVDHLAEMLKAKDPKRSIKDVLVENVRETANRVKRLNLTDSQELTDFADMVIRKLCASDGQTLRDSETVRASVAKDADSLANNLARIIDPENAPDDAPTKPAKPAKTKAAKSAKVTKPAPVAPTTHAAVDATMSSIASMMGMTS